MHFFIDHTKLTAQSNTDGYGPDPADPTLIYNVTSRFQLAEAAKAFACEAGLLVVQQSVVDSSLVNLIVKPTGVAALADVAYYVYRGVLKESLIAAGCVLQATGTNELLTRIWDGMPADTSCGTLGYDQGQTIPDTADIESIFDGSHATVKPVFVKEAEWIGSFGAAFRIGFEVLLNTQRFPLTLGYVRAERQFVNATGLTGMDLRIRREQILGFADPAAFFGLHLEQRVAYSEYGPGKVVKKTTKSPGSNFIYTKLLQRFATRNRVYLDIRSEKGYSYNFYGNYAEPMTMHNIDVAVQSAAAVAQAFETQGWPIFFSDVAQPTSGSSNNFKIRLRTDDNLLPIFYLRNLNFRERSKRKSNFIKEAEILDTAAGPPSGWSKRLQFSFPNVGTGASPRLSVATYIKLNYFRQQHNGTSPHIGVLLNEKYYDSAFCSIDLPRLGDPAAVKKMAHSAEPIFVREPNNADGTGNFALNMANGAYWDGDRVLFYCTFQYEYSAKVSEKEYLNTYGQKLYLAMDSDYTGSELLQRTEILCRQYTVGAATINIPSINFYRSRDLKATRNHKENAMLLGLTVAQVASLKADNQLGKLHHRFIHLQAAANNPQMDTGGHRFFRYTVQLQGMPGNGDPIRVTPLHAGQPIVVYSRDNQFFSSSEFAAAETVTAGQKRIEFHIFHDGCVKVTDNKDLALVHDVEQIHYVYFDAMAGRHDIASLDLLLIDKMGKGAEVSSIPTGHVRTIDYTSHTGVDADTSYIYANGDVITQGEKGSDPDVKIKYKNTGKKTFLVLLTELNYMPLQVDFRYFETRRHYCRPEVAAAFIGMLVDVGAFVDSPMPGMPVPFDVRSSGSCFEDGTSFPSLEHNNGNAIDTLYQNDITELTEDQQLARDQAIVDGMRRYGAKKVLRGTDTHYSGRLRRASNGRALHNSHLHSGDFTLNDCNRDLP
jgi:hypothetical protein